MSGRFLAGALAGAMLLAGHAAATAQSWRLEAEESRIGFTARQGPNELAGAFERFDAEIAFDPQRPEAASVVMVVDIASLTLDDPSRRGEVLSQAGLDAGTFGEARYETVTLAPIGGDRYAARARLTLRGVTRDIDHEAVIRVTGEQAVAEGTVRLDRNAFGVGQGPFASAEIMAPEVLVRFSIAARRVGG